MKCFLLVQTRQDHLELRMALLEALRRASVWQRPRQSSETRPCCELHSARGPVHSSLNSAHVFIFESAELHAFSKLLRWKQRRGDSGRGFRFFSGSYSFRDLFLAVLWVVFSDYVWLMLFYLFLLFLCAAFPSLCFSCFVVFLLLLLLCFS